MDAAILDWSQAGDLPCQKLRDLLIAVFGSAMVAAQNADPRVRGGLG
jgi:hypothetical protein